MRGGSGGGRVWPWGAKAGKGEGDVMAGRTTWGCSGSGLRLQQPWLHVDIAVWETTTVFGAGRVLGMVLRMMLYLVGWYKAQHDGGHGRGAMWGSSRAAGKAGRQAPDGLAWQALSAACDGSRDETVVEAVELQVDMCTWTWRGGRGNTAVVAGIGRHASADDDGCYSRQ